MSKRIKIFIKHIHSLTIFKNISDKKECRVKMYANSEKRSLKGLIDFFVHTSHLHQYVIVKEKILHDTTDAR